VVATGGYAELIAARLPEISVVAPDLTLEGLRLHWVGQTAAGGPKLNNMISPLKKQRFGDRLLNA